MINELIDLLLPLYSLADKKGDYWNRINIECDEEKGSIKYLKDLYDFVNRNSYGEFINIKINDELVEVGDSWNGTESIFSWQILVDKNSDFFYINGIHYSFFLSVNSFLFWQGTLDDFGSENIFSERQKAVIYVVELKHKLSGNCFSIIPYDSSCNIDPLFFSENHLLPATSQVSEQINLLSTKNVEIEPKKFVFDTNEITHAEFSTVKRIAINHLAASVVKEFYYDRMKILLDGPRRTYLSFLDKANYESVDYEKLLGLVEWIYEDTLRAEIKLALVQERLSLDIDKKYSFIDNLANHLDDAFSQAKERYKFVILERKDEYLKELRHLLDDLKKQSNTVSLKVSSLLSNLLRDVLAAIILIAFSIFTKIETIGAIKNGDIIDYLFKGLSIYYLVSLLFQLGVIFADIISAKSEFNHWKSVTRNLLPRDEIESHAYKSLRVRMRSLYILGPLIILLYVLFIVGIWCFPNFLNILKK